MEKKLNLTKSEVQALEFRASAPDEVCAVLADEGAIVQDSDLRFVFTVCDAVVAGAYLGRDGPLAKDGKAKLLSFALHEVIDGGYAQVDAAWDAQSNGEISSQKAHSVEKVYWSVVFKLASHFDWEATEHSCHFGPPEESWIHERA